MHTQKLKKGLVMGGLCLSVVFFNTGCANLSEKSKLSRVRTGSSSENKNLFANSADFESRQTKITAGMTKEEAFAAFGVERQSFKQLTRPEIKEQIFASEPHPDSAEATQKLEEFFAQYEAFSIRYADVKKYTGFSVTTDMKKRETGPDQSFVILLKDGKVVRTLSSGSAKIERTNTDNLLIKGIEEGLNNGARTLDPR